MSLLEFYGKECPHCISMAPIIEKLIKDGIKIEQHEVWHDQKNAKLMEEYDKGLCGGVPFFYNTETKKSICGGASEDDLRSLY
ncbi:MAG: thioredoxin domain-containing protein [Patescibacteria group bacterium]